MPQALKMFIDERAHQVIQKGLYRNFILHLGKFKFLRIFKLGILETGDRNDIFLKVEQPTISKYCNVRVDFLFYLIQQLRLNILFNGLT